MLEVTAIRKAIEPTWQSRRIVVRIHGFDKLTPKAARAALEIAFGNANEGEVWYTEKDNETGETVQEYGYRVYQNTTRKVFPQW